MTMEENNSLDQWIELISRHIQLRPAMTARDVYKLLYQGILGPEHIMPSAEIFTARLREEIQSLQADPDEPLLEPIRPDSRLNRLNLRPWLSQDKNLEWLVKACLETGKLRWETQQEFRQVWYRFADLIQDGFFPGLSLAETQALQVWLEENNFPAAHHSKDYLSIYRPAYRLVAFDLLSVESKGS